MKIILFLLIPVIVFSQTPDYPDTLYLKSGQVYPCLITQVNDNLVKLIYKNNMPTSAGLLLVDRIYLEQFKTIYEDENYTTDITKLKTFISQRDINLQSENDQLIPGDIECSSENKFSFGILFVPYLYADIHYYMNNPFYGYRITYIVGKIESFFESQLTYELAPNLRLLFNVGYGSSYIKERYEYHQTSSYYSNDGGEELVNDMDIFNFNLGLKYYFTKIIENEVSAYFLAGIGKQFAFVDNKEKDLYPDPYQQSYSSDNESEFLEEINSPFNANIGFGVEYFFNKSLSLDANMRLIYVTYSSEFKYNYNYQDNHESRSEKIENSEITKRVGLGLNFYF